MSGEKVSWHNIVKADNWPPQVELMMHLVVLALRTGSVCAGSLTKMTHIYLEVNHC